jgi:hypothetical protein
MLVDRRAHFLGPVALSTWPVAEVIAAARSFSPIRSTGRRRANGRAEAAHSGLVAFGHRLRRQRRQDVVHVALAELLPIDDDEDHFSGVIVPTGTISFRSRVGGDLHPTLDQVDDPVDRDAAPGVGIPLLAAVAR